MNVLNYISFVHFIVHICTLFIIDLIPQVNFSIAFRAPSGSGHPLIIIESQQAPHYTQYSAKNEHLLVLVEYGLTALKFTKFLLV